MRKILLMVAVAVLAAFVMFAQDKGGKGAPGGGKAPKAPPKNLKVFTQENWTAVGRPMMDVFVTSLGLADKGGCTYCHIGPGQFDDDSKPPKNVARMMIGNVRMRMRFAERVEVAAGARPVWRAAVAFLVNVKAVLAGCEAADVRGDRDPVAPLRECHRSLGGVAAGRRKIGNGRRPPRRDGRARGDDGANHKHANRLFHGFPWTEV